MMSKDRPRLGRLGVLAPAALSACMDASVLAVPAAGAIVSTVLKELSKAFMLKKWFHGIMSAKEAEHLMMEKGRNGSFLVRESLAHPGEYVLSVRVSGRVSHVMIRKQQNKYDVGSGEQFDDLVGLIEHFRSYPIIETSGDVLRLLQPVSGTCLRMSDMDQKVQEMDVLQNPDNESKSEGEPQPLEEIEFDDMEFFTMTEGMKEENVHKNRYRNILPYDQTRVVLRGREGRNVTDYINANYIRCSDRSDSPDSVRSYHSLDSAETMFIDEMVEVLPPTSQSISEEVFTDMKKYTKFEKINRNTDRNIVKDKVYIASQGCLPSTIGDFWHMVWQEDVRVITMITHEYEKGKKKCDRYWPQFGYVVHCDEITVKSIAETHYEDYTVREFDVIKGDVCRAIFQFQYTCWPDHGTPADPDSVLSLMEHINRKMNQISKQKDAPEQNVLCVHCSAGVGRTGTFIVLDMLVDKIKRCKDCEVDVHNTVKMVRTQRNGMVQNKAQYKFIHNALRNYIDENVILNRNVQLLPLHQFVHGTRPISV